MRKFLFSILTVLAVILPARVFGDVGYVPLSGSYVFLTGELLGSYEIQLLPRIGIPFWGGLVWLYPLDGSGPLLDYSGWGFEAAVEGRSYFSGDDIEGFFTGVYFGLAVMRTPEAYRTTESCWAFGTSLGVKFGYKLAIYAGDWRRLVIEPYASLSQPVYYFDGDWRGPWNGRYPMLTVGVRFVYEFHKRVFRY